MLNPIGIAARGKGAWNAARRVVTISNRYGATPRKTDGLLRHFSALLKEYDCGATFPLVAAALARNKGVAEKYEGGNIELAIHGYYHVDQSRLSLETQTQHFVKAKRVFESCGLAVSGFRCPYLRWNEDTLTAVKRAGLLYDTSQVIEWNVAKDAETESYRRVLGFYGAVSAKDYVALPRFENGLVRIPYCVPDDEALVDRLHFANVEAASKPWLAILEGTYRLGELFTLGLHPERIYLCEAALRETLHAARQLRPEVWFARLDVISRWWLDRANAQVTVADEGTDLLKVSVTGPEGVTVLARNVVLKAETKEWDGVYRQVNGTSFTVQSERRPFIGVSPSSAPYLASFLRQQGYILESAVNPQSHSLYFDRPEFDPENERALLEQIENSDAPLVRLGRWPNGAKSALCVTGDIDALTIWDYWFRFLGK